MTMNSQWMLMRTVLALAALCLIGCQPGNVSAGHPAVGRSSPAIDIPGARVPAQGLLTGGQPTPEQLQQAANMGFRSVINLRPVGERGEIPNEAKIVSDLGMRYFHVPIDGVAGLTEENARRFSEALAGAGSPTMVHCASGNRVGAMFSLKAFLVDGAPIDEAMAIGREAGMSRLESATREFLEDRRARDRAESATPR